MYQELNFKVLYHIFNKVKFLNQIDFDEEGEVNICEWDDIEKASEMTSAIY